MGGSSKKATAPAKQETTYNAAMRPMTEVPAAMPGQLDALTQQLAMGFGMDQPDLLALLNQYYQPMSLPDYSPGAIPAPATPDPAASSPLENALKQLNGDKKWSHSGPSRSQAH